MKSHNKLQILSFIYKICEISLYLQKRAMLNDRRYFQMNSLLNGADFIKTALSLKIANFVKKKYPG